MDLKSVLFRAWEQGFSTNSDFARVHANEVAASASLGFITTRIKTQTAYGTVWRITKTGIEVLDECYFQDGQ